jgi:hypothetical protein
VCVVTSGEGVVQGLLGRESLRSAKKVRAEDAMSLGPSTIRPSARRDAVVERMRDQELSALCIAAKGTLFA